jgi:hypothetical protein
METSLVSFANRQHLQPTNTRAPAYSSFIKSTLPYNKASNTMVATIAFPGVNMFEAISDDIDHVNAHKTSKGHDNDIYEKSQFDQDKDTTTFRQFNDACDRVKSFYAQQHTLQTTAFNIQARKEFHSRTRAEMTIWKLLRSWIHSWMNAILTPKSLS